MMDFRKSPGEYIHQVYIHGKSFVIMKAGKAVARLVPMSDATIIESDGEVIGEKPLTAGPDGAALLEDVDE